MEHASDLLFRGQSATIRQEQQDIGIAARDARAQVLPNVDVVHQIPNQQQQSANAVGQQAADLAAPLRQQMADRAAEQRAELPRLSKAHAVAEIRQRMAESALLGFAM